MELLLDTHAFLWFAEGNKLLSPHALALIENRANTIYVSMVSFFEMAIKIKIGKLSLNGPLVDYYNNALSNGINILPLSENHIFEYNSVPLSDTHRDPFDRLIIATALYQRLTIISIDKKL
ncbi:MAG TPA: type II toxin-antitoxin system VapC family toxin [Chitinophagaceae bacterium]|nr:type II toxin-antitoxin system VapC family toxin [Chitinophagaceae bacterium]